MCSQGVLQARCTHAWLTGEPSGSVADEAPKASQGIPSKLTLNLLAPHQAIFKAQEVDQVRAPWASLAVPAPQPLVRARGAPGRGAGGVGGRADCARWGVQVIIPGADGMFGVLPGHVPTISELKPGVLEVTTAPGEITKYFISSGFAFAHADSTLDVCGIEVRCRSRASRALLSRRRCAPTAASTRTGAVFCIDRPWRDRGIDALGDAVAAEQIVKLEDLDASLVSSGKTEAEAALGRATEEVPRCCRSARSPLPLRPNACSRAR